MGKYYEKKNWPSFPDDMAADLIEWSLSSERAIPASKKEPFSMLTAPWSLRQWVVENIPIDLSDEWVVTIQRFDTDYAHFHTDTIRKWSYNCLLHGEGAVTRWKEDMEGDVVETVKYDANRWYFHNSAVPHSVSEIPKQRTAVTIYKIEPEVVGTHLATAFKFLEAHSKDPYFYYV
jgi:hypothetical protein